MKTYVDFYVNRQVTIEPSDLSLSGEELGDLLAVNTEKAAEAIARLNALAVGVYDPCLVWKAAFNNLDTPEIDEVAGLHWSEAEAMLERGDIEEIKRWLMPQIALRQPRPKMKTQKDGETV
jgi:hypothetical protein